MPPPLLFRLLPGRSVAPLAALLLTLLTGCDLINPDEQVPAYLRIERFVFTPGVPDGTPSSHIPDAWVYVNNELIGAFELPATVPVLREGTATIDVFPGIYADGQRGVRFIYPFYQSFATTQALTPGQTVRIQPVTSYTTAANQLHTPFEIKEDFETNQELDKAFEIKSVPGYELIGAVTDTFRAGVGRVLGKPDTTDFFYLDSKWHGQLPQGGADVYAEFDYRSSMPFSIGVAWTLTPTAMVVNRQRNADLTIYPKREWTKIYVNLTDEISRVQNPVADFKIFIQGFPSGEPGQFLALDNFRLVRHP